jgi:hypothetical protein
MSNIVFEVLLRLVKPAISLILGIVLFAVATGPLGATGSVELGLLCWVSGAAFILLAQESPI